MGNVEHVVLMGVAIAISAGVLLALADTPFYPVALGIVIVAVFYVVADNVVVINQVNSLLQKGLG